MHFFLCQACKKCFYSSLKILLLNEYRLFFFFFCQNRNISIIFITAVLESQNSLELRNC